jgi:hypothetical protein
MSPKAAVITVSAVVAVIVTETETGSGRSD